MSDPALDRLIDLAIDQATRVLVGKPGAALMPTFVVESGDRIALLATPWHSDLEKELTTQSLREVMQHLDIQRYSFLSEAWMATAPATTPQEISKQRYSAEEMPLQRPDRIEVVLVSAADKTREQGAILRIVRGEGGTVVRLDRAEGDDEIISLGGRFHNLLKPDDGAEQR